MLCTRESLICPEWDGLVTQVSGLFTTRCHKLMLSVSRSCFTRENMPSTMTCAAAPGSTVTLHFNYFPGTRNLTVFHTQQCDMRGFLQFRPLPTDTTFAILPHCQLLFH